MEWKLLCIALCLQEEWHLGHNPADVNSLRMLHLDPAIENQIICLYNWGIKPSNIPRVIKDMQLAGALPSAANHTTPTAGYLSKFANSRLTVSQEQVRQHWWHHCMAGMWQCKKVSSLYLDALPMNAAG